MPGFVPTVIATVSLLAMTVVPGSAATPAGDPLAVYHWKSRVLVVVAPDAADPKLQAQRSLFKAMGRGATERDLALVEAIGTMSAAAALRQRFGLDDGFHAVLVGKDGGDKLTSADPLGSDQLFPLIDAMPMRQNEMDKS